MQSTATMELGSLRTAPLGVGTWAWGTRNLWGYGGEYGSEQVAAAFRASLAEGLTLFDTAEIYGNGSSERILGELVCVADGERPLVATKFAPLPYRLNPRSVLKAIDGSLSRLGASSIDLYQIHFPSPLLSTKGLMDALAEAVKEGKIREVGVSNYNAAQMYAAYEALARHGVRLASNQVHYSLLNRAPETNGVLDACRDLGVTLIAYSPLAQGLLTGKYGPGVKPSGMMRRVGRSFSERNLAKVEPVVRILRQLGENHGREPSQVALNWLAERPGVLPIPGAKNESQARQNAGALVWDLSEEERERLDLATLGWR
jgi:aryl-alcohol dehydrogenase-like predicted oxidoreductase